MRKPSPNCLGLLVTHLYFVGGPMITQDHSKMNKHILKNANLMSVLDWEVHTPDIFTFDRK